jgi:hypothetical protein
LIATVAILALVSACVPIRQPEQAGFLSTYENLDVVGNDRLFYPGSRVGDYTKFIIDPTVLLFVPNPDEARFTPDELAGLLEYFDNAMVEQLSKDNHNGPGYEIVEEPGAGVARIRIGINDVEETIAVLNILIYTKITGAAVAAEYYTPVSLIPGMRRSQFTIGREIYDTGLTLRMGEPVHPQRELTSP